MQRGMGSAKRPRVGMRFLCFFVWLFDKGHKALWLLYLIIDKGHEALWVDTGHKGIVVALFNLFIQSPTPTSPREG